MSTITLIGKESNKLDEREAGLIGDLADVLNTYGSDRRTWNELVRPVLNDLPTRTLSEQARLDPRTIQRIRAGKTKSRRRHRVTLTFIAADLVAEILTDHGLEVPADPFARLGALPRQPRPIDQAPLCALWECDQKSSGAVLLPKLQEAAYRARLRRL